MLGVCLSVAELEHKFWAEAVNTTCFIVNHSMTKTFNSKVSEEVWSKKFLNYSIFRVFGYDACLDS